MNGMEFLNITSNLSVGNTNQCTCNSSSNNSGDVFDMVLISLLRAMANNNETCNVNKTANLNKLSQNQNQNIGLGLETQNSIQTSNKIEVTSKSEDTKQRIENAVSIASKKYNVDANLIKSIIKVESNFNPKVVSSAGAKGLMQLMPENCRDLGVKDPFNIEENIDAGTRHIKEYLDKYNGNVEMGLMAFNGGPGRMARRGVTSIAQIYKMPKETQNYVPKVMKYYRG
ncbi:lytic transglycosylase domain-containing protein [Romboutsia maritimum]|uniref:Lytic transglycosylase domain-containing protein n=1 Tax=Romboutsia maritimum TaxID=2020948 RepID=A0A371IVJ4_9FIRM|nr:lytic transglycosylase domain-containing protein [Romboutsia maritimum]RDY24495.1 lytic transglycosylase domain-containing protein [Romboutsia maritimum]